MTRLAVLLIASVLLVASGPQPTGEHAAVERAVRNYVEALYEVKPELIVRSVHPALTKRGTYRPKDSTEYRVPGLMSYEQLVDLAGRWNVNDQRGTDLEYTIEVLDVMDVTAAAKLSADWGIDYMHLTKVDGQWKIIHVLWQSYPPDASG